MADQHPASLVPSKSDADLAEEYRARIRAPLEEILTIITEARKAGLIVGFAITPDQYGRPQVGHIDVTKPL